MYLRSDRIKRNIVIAVIPFAGEMAVRQESATAVVPPLLPESYTEGALPPLASEVFDDVRALQIIFVLYP